MLFWIVPVAQNIAHSVKEEICKATFAQLWEAINLWIEDIKETFDHILKMIENYPSFKQNRQILIKVFHDIVKVQTDLEMTDQNVCL